MKEFRPVSFGDFVGQREIVSMARLFVDAAVRRQEPLDHMLLSGPPGLGKTTLAHVVANELGVGFVAVGATAVERAGDLVSLLVSLDYRDVLFIDEIHRLKKPFEEMLYLAMEEWVVDIPTGKGAFAKVVRMELNPFTLIGATTHAGMLSAPLRSRFGITFTFDFYKKSEISEIVMRSAAAMKLDVTLDAAMAISDSSRGVPRVANRLLKRVRDFAQVNGIDKIDRGVVLKALEFLKIDSNGLDRLDYAFLNVLIDRFGGGPVGIGAIASVLGEDEKTLKDVCEPYLLKLGLIARTPRGRVATQKAFSLVGKEGCTDGT